MLLPLLARPPWFDEVLSLVFSLTIAVLLVLHQYALQHTYILVAAVFDTCMDAASARLVYDGDDPHSQFSFTHFSGSVGQAAVHSRP